MPIENWYPPKPPSAVNWIVAEPAMEKSEFMSVGQRMEVVEIPGGIRSQV